MMIATEGDHKPAYVFTLRDGNLTRIRRSFVCSASHPPSGCFAFRHGGLNMFPFANWTNVSIGGVDGLLPTRWPAKPFNNSILCLVAGRPVGP